jgi:GT2 family glycosyltransferase
MAVCDISVVIVNWNGRDLLLECLKSIEDDELDARLEIIVVDNGSTDGSVEAVEREFPAVKVIKNDENLGFSRANNIGIRHCSGRYISLVNSDVEVLPGCLESLMQLCDAHADIGLAGPKVLRPDGSAQVSCGKLPSFGGAFLDAALPLGAVRRSRFLIRLLGLRSEFEGLTDVQMLSGCFWFARREAVDEVGLLDERFFIYSEDSDWCKRFHESKWRIVFFPDAAAIHLGEGSSSIAPVKFYLEMQKARFAYWEKHHGVVGKAYYASMLVLHELVRLVGGAGAYVVDVKGRARHKALVLRSVKCLAWVFSPSSGS